MNEASLGFVHVVDGDDVRVVEGGGGPRLLDEPSAALRVVVARAPLIGKELQGDGAVQAGVLGLVHDTHPPASQLFDQAVVGDALADHRAPRATMLADSL
jgi:hypothetical protein